MSLRGVGTFLSWPTPRAGQQTHSALGGASPGSLRYGSPMSAKTYSFEINRTSRARPEVLFRLETDGPLWSTWAKPLVVQASWRRRGSPTPAGVGAIRRVGLWPVLISEETLEFVPNRKHVYTFAGTRQPARNYRGEVLFTPNASGGTDLRWQGSFTEAMPGTGPITLLLLRTAINYLSGKLVRAAERDTGR